MFAHFEEFIGSVVTLFLEMPDGSEFKVQVQERELADMDLKHTGQSLCELGRQTVPIIWCRIIA